jgi:hypothetical protein
MRVNGVRMGWAELGLSGTREAKPILERRVSGRQDPLGRTGTVTTRPDRSVPSPQGTSRTVS